MTSSFIQAIQNLRVSQEFFADFIRQSPGTKGAKLANDYGKKLQWILNDLMSQDWFSEKEKQSMRKDLQSDLLAIPDMHHKISLLSAEKREIIDMIIDSLLKNEPIEFALKQN